MLAIFTDPAYDFIGWRRWAYGVSVALMLLGLGSILARGGLRYDIDFTGGTLVEVRLAEPMPVGTIRSHLTAAGLGESIIQVFGDPRDVLIRTHVTETDPAQLSRRVREALGGQGTGAPKIRRVEFVGPQIGQELRRQALYAVLAALAGILVYIWIRFDFRGGVVTIVSLAHDVLRGRVVAGES
jgi:preprotein translocase subunit SecF